MDRWRHFAAVLIMLLTLMPLLFAQKKADRGSGGQQEASPDSSAGAASSGILKQDFRNYRGQRKPVESGDLYMESFVSEYSPFIVNRDSARFDSCEIDGIEVNV